MLANTAVLTDWSEERRNTGPRLAALQLSQFTSNVLSCLTACFIRMVALTVHWNAKHLPPASNLSSKDTNGPITGS
jgi:hypothetical protein